MKLYHYSVESFPAGDDELIGDYKHQYSMYEPYILCLRNHKNLFDIMLYMARYNQVCAEDKGKRMFSFWAKDATEAVFEYVRTMEFAEASASRITGIYYCESSEQAIKYLTEDCINTAGFKKEDVSLFEIELEKDIFFTYDQSFYNEAYEFIKKFDVENAVQCARCYFNGNRKENPRIEIISEERNKIVRRIEF
ncbi:MAG: hypothetical protein LUI13_06685 [Lachnospiraceae bacterium]|nr:hypothetical protein [Lachnospiraceae bacterium]